MNKEENKMMNDTEMRLIFAVAKTIKLDPKKLAETLDNDEELLEFTKKFTVEFARLAIESIGKKKK